MRGRLEITRLLSSQRTPSGHTKQQAKGNSVFWHVIVALVPSPIASPSQRLIIPIFLPVIGITSVARMWCTTPVVKADRLQRALSVSDLVGEANRRNDTTMKRALHTLRLLAGTLLVAMGLMAISPAAHAAPLASAARSVSVTFRNQTTYTLHNRTYQVMSGIWTLHPPEYIAPGQEVYWRTESNGFMTGTSGMVFY